MTRRRRSAGWLLTTAFVLLLARNGLTKEERKGEHFGLWGYFPCIGLAAVRAHSDDGVSHKSIVWPSLVICTALGAWVAPGFGLGVHGEVELNPVFGALHTQIVLHGYPDPAGGWSIQGGLGVGRAGQLINSHDDGDEAEDDSVGGWGPEGHIGVGYAWAVADDWDPALLLRLDLGTYHTQGLRLAKYGPALIFRLMMH